MPAVPSVPPGRPRAPRRRQRPGSHRHHRHRPEAPRSTSRGRETTAGAADAAEEVGGTTPPPPPPAITSGMVPSRTLEAPPPPPPFPVLAPPPLKPPAVEGLWPSGPLPPTRTVSNAPGTTDTVAVVRPPMPRAEADARPAPFAARRACGINGDRDDAGGHSKELLAAGVGERHGTGRRQIDREGLRAARPAGRRDRHRPRTRSCGRIEHEAGGQRRAAAHDDVVDRDAATGDGHRRGADDEVGARQRDRDRLAPESTDSARRSSASARRRIDREGLCATQPAGCPDRDRASPNGCTWIDHDSSRSATSCCPR